MTQEFYLKTQALHEEFQKRELYYLNTERKLRSSIMSKKEFNLPFQEYLQRINQREKESEEAYRNIMKQMEELDRHTDVMSVKLEKLGMLRNSLTSLAFPNWSSSIEPNLQSYDTMQSINFKSINSNFESLEHNIKSVFERNLKSISTQTENTVYCEKCHSVIHTQPRHIIGNETPSYLNIQSGIISEPQSMHIKSQEYSSTFNDVHGYSQFVSSSVNSKPFIVPGSINNSSKGVNSKMPQQINEKSPENIQSDVILSEKHVSVEKQLESNKSLTESVQNEIKESEEKLTESQHSENENFAPNSQDVDFNVDTFVSKSDVESVNNEFDFLESDTRIVSSKTKDQNVFKSGKCKSNDADVNLGKAVSLVVEHPSEPPLKHKDKDIHFTEKLELSDNKSETSGSVSAPHSPAISDSDSVYGKGSPLTASAAYQALLGNTVIPQKTKVDDSDSESADEVENVLANVVQRSNVKSKFSKTSQIAETKKKSSVAVDSKPAVKEPKLPSSNKPQFKLNKNTRKVLGFDTSSGSEVELAVKPPEKKIEEDSDEFDFYD